MRCRGQIKEDLSRMDGDEFLGERTRRKGRPWSLQIGAQPGGQEGCGVGGAAMQCQVSMRWRVSSCMYVLCNAVVGRCQNSGQLLDQMRPIARLFELLDHRDHNVIIDPFSVNFGIEI